MGVDGNSGASYAGIASFAQYANGTSLGATRDNVWDALQSQSILTVSGDFSTWTGGFGLARSGVQMYSYAQEFIIYNSDQSSNRTKIEEDINDAFNIYSVALSPTERSFLGKYPDAAAAYSVRNLTGKSKQPIVKVRRELGVDTDTEETIYADSTGFLDQSQLLNFVNEVNEDPRLPLDISEGYGYSLRVVKAGYTGPLIQVRESGGDTTKDIYADASGNINVETLKTFCGSNDGHVVKWYNQGGVDRTLEADAAANQPKIVEAGVVVRDTLNNVALKFTTAGNEFLAIQDAAAFDLQEQCIAMHFMSTALPASGSKRIIGIPQPIGESYNSTIRNNIEITFLGNLAVLTGVSNVTLASLAQTVNSPSILTFNFKGGDSSGTSNKTTQAATITANDVKGLSVGARFTTTATPDMLVAEVIQYTSAQFDDNKNEIEASLNKHYQIYGDAYVSTWYDQSTAADDTYLLDSSPGAAAAYSLRKLRENYTGKAINIRRDSDQNHLDIGFTSSGELDVDAIINFCGGANGYVTTWYNQAFNSTNELLLDTTEGQGAEAAYSVRQLSSTATECMIIRRASDSKLRTIGFKNRDIDEAAIESFCKGTTCTVQTWKDQSGNGNDATASGTEPTIYTGGAITKLNGRPYIYSNTFSTRFLTNFDGSSDAWSFYSGGIGGKTIFYSSISPIKNELIAESGSTNQFKVDPSVTVYKDGTSYAPSNRDAAYNDMVNSQFLLSLNHNSSVWTDLVLGYQYSGFVVPNAQEWIYYNADKSSDRTSIESNINGYYGIYSTNNATQDAQANQPKIYDATAGVVTLNGKPATFFDGADDGFEMSLGGISVFDNFIVNSSNDPRAIWAYDGSANYAWLAQNGGTASPISNYGSPTLYKNGAEITIGTSSDLYNDIRTGELLLLSDLGGSTSSWASYTIANRSTSSQQWAGFVCEMIFYSSDQSNNRLEIEGNINSHYRIYGSNDASQSTSTAQPKLVSAGRVILENGRPAVEFDGVNDRMTSAATAASDFTTSVVLKALTASQSNQWLLQDTSGSDMLLRHKSTNYDFYDGTTTHTIGTAGTDQHHIFITANTSGSVVSFDGADQSISGILNNGYTDLEIGGDSGSRWWHGRFNEIVIWDSYQATNRTGIESSINSQFGIYWDGSKRGLLDSQPNAAAAYSVRALNSSYTGPVVEIRRDSDGTSRDIYATYNGDLDESAIETFCTGTTCTISTWYDQSGNSNDATQGTALNQPTIYTGGQLVKQGGRLALDFDGTDDGLNLTSAVGTSTVKYAFTTHLVDSTDSQWSLFNDGSSSVVPIAQSGSTAGTFFGFTITNFYKDGVALSVSNRSDVYNAYQGGANTLTTLDLGTTGFIQALFNRISFLMKGKGQEVIIYTTDKSSVRTDIEENINSYYNIYSKLPGDRLLNKFPGAAAAYSLRVLDSLYTGPLVRVRRDSDGVHADVYPDFNREISIYSKVGVLASSTDPIAAKGTTSLKSFMNGANGFVAVWYDQAESNNASQGTANYQPKIYDGTTGVVTEGSAGNEKPAMYFDGSDDRMVPSSDINASPSNYEIFAVSNSVTDANSFFFDARSGRLVLDAQSIVLTGNGDAYWDGVNNIANKFTADIQSVKTWLLDSTNNNSAAVYENGSLHAGSLPYTQRAIAGITRIGNSSFDNRGWAGYLQELVFYATTASGNRTDIEDNINTFYSIY